VSVVQTSAAISQGSSGGGLFDERGNLVGITTEMVNPEIAQNLNFAIAADEFFAP
jgi:S1-C subfamily serine protease